MGPNGSPLATLAAAAPPPRSLRRRGSIGSQYSVASGISRSSLLPLDRRSPSPPQEPLYRLPAFAPAVAPAPGPAPASAGAAAALGLSTSLLSTSGRQQRSLTGSAGGASVYGRGPPSRSVLDLDGPTPAPGLIALTASATPVKPFRPAPAPRPAETASWPPLPDDSIEAHRDHSLRLETIPPTPAVAGAPGHQLLPAALVRPAAAANTLDAAIAAREQKRRRALVRTIHHEQEVCL